MSEGENVKRIAITGNIGCGKSTVCEIIEDAGFRMINADRIVHQIYQNNQSVRDTLVIWYGSTIIAENGHINRQLLRNILMKDVQEKSRIENLIHPLVKLEIDAFFDYNANQNLVFAEIPLLFEVGWQNRFDQIWLVVCPESLRLSRIMKSRNVDEQTAQQLISLQIPQDQKIPFAHRVIQNDMDITRLQKQVLSLLNVELERVKNDKSQ